MEPEKTQEKEINNIPTIRTFESDILNVAKEENLDQKAVISKQLDSVPFSNVDIGESVEKEKNRRKIINIILYFICFLSVVTIGLSYFYYYTVHKNIVQNTSIKNNNSVKIFTISDIINNAPKQMVDSTTAATSTRHSIILRVSDFDTLFPYMLANEKIIASMIKGKFGYSNVDVFDDFSVNNYDLRIADGGTGAFVYGFVGKDRLIIADSISEWFKSKNNYK